MAESVMAATAVASLLAGTTQGVVSYNAEKHAKEDMANAQAAAEAKQQAADEKAERQRLEALAADQTATDYGNIWGADSARYVDAAQKLSAGTGSFDTDDDETNPFYQRGLL